MIYSNFKKLIFLLLPVLFLSCNEEQIIQPIAENEVITIDSLEVKLIYENSSCFKYPIMKYEVSYVVELSKPGAICGYILECGSFNTSSNSDYFKHFEANHKFRGKYTHWSKDLIDINSVLPFKLTFCYDVADEYVSQIFEYNSFLIVAHQNENSCKENAQQLT